MQTMTLDESKISTLRGALELARDKYRENATSLRAVAGHERLAEQFDRQAEEADAVLEEIDRDETDFDFESAIVNRPGEDLVKTVLAVQQEDPSPEGGQT